MVIGLVHHRLEHLPFLTWLHIGSGGQIQSLVLSCCLRAEQAVVKIYRFLFLSVDGCTHISKIHLLVLQLALLEFNGVPRCEVHERDIVARSKASVLSGC